jgi:hypothetical protein
VAVRRDRPGLDLAGDSVNVTLPDGRTMAVPVKPRDQATADVCCFCGERVELSDPEWTRLGVLWRTGGGEHRQTWEAHRSCMSALMHDRVKGDGPFFEAT